MGLLKLKLFVRNIGLVGPPELVASSRLLIYWACEIEFGPISHVKAQKRSPEEILQKMSS